MADVLPLPTRALSASGLQRVLGQLRQAHETGADLGPRAPHIQAGITSLREMARALRLSAQQPRSAQPGPKLFSPGTEQHLLDLASTVEHLADCAAAFSEAAAAP